MTLPSYFSPGGDLTGTPQSQTVNSIQGVVITGTPNAGQIIGATSSLAANWQDVVAQLPTTITTSATTTLSSPLTSPTIIQIQTISITGPTILDFGGSVGWFMIDCSQMTGVTVGVNTFSVANGGGGTFDCSTMLQSKNLLTIYCSTSTTLAVG